MARAPIIAVCGASQATEQQLHDAAEVGRLLVAGGCVVVCGGLGGVMEACAQGVRGAGGICIGLLPGDDPSAGASDLTVAIATGMGEMRNALIVRSAAGVVAIGGAYGTLSEIGLALRLARPVAALHTWSVRPPGGDTVPDDDLHEASDPDEAVTWLLRRVGRREG